MRHTWRTPESPRESSAEGIAASEEYLMSGHNGDRPPARAGRISADSGVGITTREGLARIGRGRTKASPELEEGVGVPCDAGAREEGEKEGT